VTRLKTEIEELKKAHSAEIIEITSSCSAEIEEAKKSFDIHRVEGIARLSSA
jgi:hypothetical protein